VRRSLTARKAAKPLNQGRGQTQTKTLLLFYFRSVFIRVKSAAKYNARLVSLRQSLDSVHCKLIVNCAPPWTAVSSPLCHSYFRYTSPGVPDSDYFDQEFVSRVKCIVRNGNVHAVGLYTRSLYKCVKELRGSTH